MSDIDTDTEDLLRRRLHQLAAHGTAGTTWTPAGRPPTPSTGSSDGEPVLATVQPRARPGRHRPPLSRPAALALALSAAAAVLVGVVALTGRGEPSGDPVVADGPDVTTAVEGATDAPPYLELSGTHWSLTGFRDVTGTWVEVREAAISPSDRRYDFGFVAGHAYGSLPCGDWLTSGFGGSSSTVTYQCAPEVFVHPVDVVLDGETLTVVGGSGNGGEIAIRARRDGDAEPQTVPKAWLADTIWAVRSAGDAAPTNGEDLAWIRFVPGSLPDGNGAVTSFVATQDVTPCDGGGVDTTREVPLRCTGGELHQQAVGAATTLWGAAQDVTLAGDELVVTAPGGELRARLVAAAPSTSAADPAAPLSTVVQGGVHVVPDDAPPVLTAEVTGRSFRVLSVVDANGQALAVEGVPVRFDGGVITGGSGCSSFTGTYLPLDTSQSETGGLFTVTSMSKQGYSCVDTARPEVDALVEALERGTYAWRNGDLSLRTGEGQHVTLVADQFPGPSSATTAFGGAGEG